ncbi:MAG TPA: GNAT family N-acetyltransferase, partial [Candidatus Angelobacter sp.]|nr:GNAT family N-acetyltransferase [Candidatus Angelobacter sp.]
TTPEPIEVRPVRPEEVEEAYTAGGLLDNDRGYGAHVRDVAGRVGDVPVLVAVRGGRIVGTVTIAPHGSSHSELAREGEVEFRYLGVAPEAWGSGVATRLVDAVEDYAAATGAHHVVLCVIEANVAAARVYERLGFTRAPDRDWEPVPGVLLRVWQRPVRSA